MSESKSFLLMLDGELDAMIPEGLGPCDSARRSHRIARLISVSGTCYILRHCMLTPAGVIPLRSGETLYVPSSMKTNSLVEYARLREAGPE